jgi:hypothetical protein
MKQEVHENKPDMAILHKSYKCVWIIHFKIIQGTNIPTGWLAETMRTHPVDRWEGWYVYNTWEPHEQGQLHHAHQVIWCHLGWISDHELQFHSQTGFLGWGNKLGNLALNPVYVATQLCNCCWVWTMCLAHLFNLTAANMLIAYEAVTSETQKTISK